MKASDWISVEDKLPKIRKRVIVCQSFNDGSTFARMATRVQINQTDRWYDDEGFEIEYISHWQPIVLPKKRKVMKPQELSIGNLVCYNGKVVKVEQITKRKIGYHTKPNETRMNYARLCEIEPIPITEELLTKIGFKKDKNGYFNYREYNDELSIRFSGNYTFIEYANLHFNPEDVTETNYSSSLEFPNTQHLHTLQNIWHLLTGKELEIKL